MARYDLSCYYVDDEYSFEMSETATSSKEAALLKRVDLVFIHSTKLMEKKGHYNPRSFLTPNGVDFELYSTPRTPPADLVQIPEPRIGYIGALKKQLDWNLLEALALRHREYSFVFVGPMSPHEQASEAVDRMKGLPNVWFLGERPPQQLPAYVQHFHVGILPYRRIPYTEYIYPVKLHEYLATGIPVVGTPVSSLLAFRQVVELADDLDAWTAALTRASSASARSLEASTVRQAIAAEHDWRILARQVAAQIRDALNGN